MRRSCLTGSAETPKGQTTPAATVIAPCEVGSHRLHEPSPALAASVPQSASMSPATTNTASRLISTPLPRLDCPPPTMPRAPPRRLKIRAHLQARGDGAARMRAMLRKTTLLDEPALRVEDVRCGSHRTGWSPPEPS